MLRGSGEINIQKLLMRLTELRAFYRTAHMASQNSKLICTHATHNPAPHPPFLPIFHLLTNFPPRSVREGGKKGKALRLDLLTRFDWDGTDSCPGRIPGQRPSSTVHKGHARPVRPRSSVTHCPVPPVVLARAGPLVCRGASGDVCPLHGGVALWQGVVAHGVPQGA